MKLTPLAKSIQLTERTTSNALNIASALIQRIDTAPGGSCLLMLGLNDSVRTKKVYVTQTPAAIAALTGIHVLLTETTGRSFYVNAMCVRNLFDETSYRVVEYNYGGQTFKEKVTQSLASLQAAINAAGGGGAYELLTNKATTFTLINNTLYPSTEAVMENFQPIWFVAAAGTDNYTATLSPAPSMLPPGTRVQVKFANTNTGPSTFDPNGSGAKDIRKGTGGVTVLAAADLVITKIYSIVFDGSNWQIDL